MGLKDRKHGLRSSPSFAALALALSLATGCGKVQTEASFSGLACGASDQYATYMNPMDSTLIQTVSIDSTFTAAEASKIRAAIATWNAEGRRTTGRDLFRVQTMTLSASSIPGDATDCGFPGLSTAFSIVRVTSAQTWAALGFTAQNPGVTIRCASGTAYAEKQVVLLNPANMTTTPQIFQNVVLHELGHAIGLDHSCDPQNAGRPGYAGCSAQGTDPSYLEAVMNPLVNPADVKEDLRRNDEERATCALNYRP